MSKDPDVKKSTDVLNTSNLLILMSLEAILVALYTFFSVQQLDNSRTGITCTSFRIILVVLSLAGLLGLSSAIWMRSKKQHLLFLESINAKRRLYLCLFLSLFIIVISILSETFAQDPVVNSLMSALGAIFFIWGETLLIYSTVTSSEDSRTLDKRFLVISIAIIAALWVFMILTRVGLKPDIRFWNVAGVPMMTASLAGIILAILLLDSFISWLMKRNRFQINEKMRVVLEILIVFVIWVGAALLWIKTPFSNSYFFYGPLAPDAHFVPKSDAKLMDLGGQYLIIGARLETPYMTEKPYYSLFLGILHALFGQSYTLITNIQIIFLALLPALLYLLGKRFSGRWFGLAIAAYAILKEITAIGFTYKISVSNSRLMMTEFPTGLCLVFASLFLFSLFKERKTSLILPTLAGLSLGVGSFVRSNTLVVLLAIFVFLIIETLRRHEIKWKQILLFTFGAAMAILPWVIYMHANYGMDPITWKINAAIRTRLREPSNEFHEIPPTETKIPAESVKRTPSPDQNQATLPAGVQSTPSTIPEATHKAPATPVQSQTAAPTSEAKATALHAIPASMQSGKPDPYSSQPAYIFAHYLNNEVKALFTLPFQIFPAHLTTLIGLEFWREPVTWTGKLNVEQFLAFVFNLSLICLGLAYAWKRFEAAGLIPLVVHVSYYFANALVRTSGSRYLVPADWVTIFYYLLGLFWLLDRAGILKISFDSLKPDKKTESKQSLFLTMIFSLLIGLSLPVLNLSFPSLYSNESKEQVYARVPMAKIEAEVGISPESMQAFFENPNTVFLYGKGIYPVHMEINYPEYLEGNTYTLLTPARYEILIGGDAPKEPLPDGEDMIVLGCAIPDTNFVHAYLAYFVHSDKVIWSSTTTFDEICR